MIHTKINMYVNANDNIDIKSNYLLLHFRIHTTFIHSLSKEEFMFANIQ